MAVSATAAVVLAVAAVQLKNLVRAVVAYALASVFLAALFFQLASPFAGAPELTGGGGRAAAPLLLAAPPPGGGGGGTLGWPALAPGDRGVGLALWSDRTFEVLVQAILLLAGVVAILLLLEASIDKEARA